MDIKPLTALLASFLTLGADAPDPPDPPAGDPPGDDPPGDELDLEDVVDAEEEDNPPEDDDGDTRAQIARERARADKAERDAREAREAADRARSSAPPAENPAAVEARRVWEAEQKILDDPNSTAEQKWYANSSRTLRQNSAQSAHAYMLAQETNDQAKFARMCARQDATGKLARRFEAQVEAKSESLKKEGKYIDRETILKFIVGEEMVKGALTAGKKQAKEPDITRVARHGRPVTRSDVTGRRGAMTDREKRAAKLDGKII